MATHSSVLAWRIPGTGKPGGLPSMGSHRVGHNWSDLAAVAWHQVMSLLFTYFYFRLCWVFVATRGLYLVMEMRAPLCCGVWVLVVLLLWSTGSRCSGFSSCGAPWHVESSQTRDRTSVPRIARQILIHCTTKGPVWRCLGETSDLQSPSPWHSSYKTSWLLWLVWFLHCSKPNLWSLCSDCLNPCGWYLCCGFISCSILLSFSLCSDLSISFVSIMLHDFYLT